MSDGFLFNDGVVKVGNGILWVAGTTYPIRAINSLRGAWIDNKLVRWCGLGAAVFGVFLAVQGDRDLYIAAAGAVAGGISTFFLAKDKFKLFVSTMGGERQVVESKDKEYVKHIRDCIESCISGESQPREMGVDRPMRTIDGTVRRDDSYLPRA